MKDATKALPTTKANMPRNVRSVSLPVGPSVCAVVSVGGIVTRGVTVGSDEGDELGDGVRLGEGDGEGVSLGRGELVGVGVGVGEALGVGVGVGAVDGWVPPRQVCDRLSWSPSASVSA